MNKKIKKAESISFFFYAIIELERREVMKERIKWFSTNKGCGYISYKGNKATIHLIIKNKTG